jgi:hypothetical protein
VSSSVHGIIEDEPMLFACCWNICDFEIYECNLHILWNLSAFIPRRTVITIWLFCLERSCVCKGVLCSRDRCVASLCRKTWGGEERRAVTRELISRITPTWGAGIPQLVQGLDQRLDDWGVRVQFPVGAWNLSPFHNVQTDLESTKPAIKWVSEAVSSGVKRQERKAHHSSLLPSPLLIFMAWY